MDEENMAEPAVTIGSGDALNAYAVPGAPAYAAQKLAIRSGTAAAPDTVAQPLLKVERTIEFTDAALEAAGFPDSAGVESFSALQPIATGTAACQVQPVGIVGVGINQCGTDSPDLVQARPDALGVYGLGIAGLDCVGAGIGGYFQARRYGESGRMTGVEIQTYNYPLTPLGYTPLGHSSCAMWINANGRADTPAGILLSNPFGRQFTYGIAFTAQAAGGRTGGVSQAAIRDDSHAVTTLLVGGAHADAIDTRGAALTGSALIMADGHRAGWSDAGIARGGPARVRISDGGAGLGDIEAAGASFAATVTIVTANAMAMRAFDSGPIGTSSGATVTLGTLATPTGAGQRIGAVNFVGAGQTVAGSVGMAAGQAWTGGARGAQLVFSTTAQGGSTSAARMTLDGSALNLKAGVALAANGLKVVGARAAGWSLPTGTASRAAFDTATIGLEALAERVKALIDDLHAAGGHGLIGD